MAKSKTKKAPPKKLIKKPLTKPVEKKVPKVSLPATSYKIGVGDSAPSTSLASTTGKAISLKDFSGRFVALYFYPKDNTPGCTVEGQDFKKLYSAFQKLDCEVLGVSKDSLKSHEGFKKKFAFPFDLLVDEEGELCKAFDVVHMKKLYGREYLGIERSTFLINPKGKIVGEWRKLKVDGHAQTVLDFLKQQVKG